MAPPWHLKHWREFWSPLLAMPSLLVLVPWLPCPLLPFQVPPVHYLVGKLELGWSIQGHSSHYGSLGDRGVTTIASLPMASLPVAAWARRGVVALLCLGQGRPELDNLLPQFCHPFPQVSCYHCSCLYLIPYFLVLTPYLVGGNHQL